MWHVACECASFLSAAEFRQGIQTLLNTWFRSQYRVGKVLACFCCAKDQPVPAQEGRLDIHPQRPLSVWVLCLNPSNTCPVSEASVVSVICMNVFAASDMVEQTHICWLFDQLLTTR